MSVTAATSSPASTSTTAAPFPKADVEATLGEELIETVKSEAIIRGIALLGAPAVIATTPFQIDSLVVVSLLCKVEPIVGFELKDSVVRAGGYKSIEMALNHLVPSIEKAWAKKYGVKP